MKDEGCEHMKCGICKKDYCFTCGAKRDPIMAHGNNYHRPNCDFYMPFDEDVKEEKCSECRRANKLCQKPKELMEGLIAPEYF
jgi:hypothetical protein